MLHSSFAVFILSHGRAQRVKTLRALRKHGYTGRVYIIIDDEDEQAEEYRKLYGDAVIQFSKDEAAAVTDTGDTIKKRNTVLFARNMCHRIARKLNIEYFCEMDDDYQFFEVRKIEGPHLREMPVQSLDNVFDCFINFLNDTDALSVCFAQSGDFIGGVGAYLKKSITRKAMNVFICRTDKPFRFVGRMNDDVNTYVTLGNRGYLFFTVGLVDVVQTNTQTRDGGLTEMYKEFGTYNKSFYTVMMQPSSVKVDVLDGGAAARVHHRIDWNCTVPKIVRQEHRRFSAL